MQIKNVAIRLSVSLAAVAIVVPLVSRVNHFARASQSSIKSGIELKADGNPMPPVPPPKGGLNKGTEVLTADGNPMPPVPPPKGGLNKGAEVLIADGNPMPPVPPPTGRIQPGLSVA